MPPIFGYQLSYRIAEIWTVACTPGALPGPTRTAAGLREQNVMLDGAPTRMAGDARVTCSPTSHGVTQTAKGSRRVAPPDASGTQRQNRGMPWTALSESGKSAASQDKHEHFRLQRRKPAFPCLACLSGRRQTSRRRFARKAKSHLSSTTS